MAPLTRVLSTLFSRSDAGPDFSAVKAQWQNPTDILSILMVIGGDIVQSALAQSAGAYGYFSSGPVAFSFGWVAYSFSAISSAVGDRRLFPMPDCECILVNAKTGQQRENRSWVLGRLVRDFERELEHTSKGLTIAFFRTSTKKTAGVTEVDWIHVLSVLVVVLQLAISCIPAILHLNFMILIITVGGTYLAFLGSILPQWRTERWAARLVKKGKREVVCLTTGNGSKAVLVIVSESAGVKLEDLAAGRVESSSYTTPAVFALAALWLVLLITVESLSLDAWYSLAVGALGMIQNAIVAGARRRPESFGLHLERYKTIQCSHVFDALREADDFECGVGVSLQTTFFTGRLQPSEIKWRDSREAELARQYAATLPKGPHPSNPSARHPYHPKSSVVVREVPLNSSSHEARTLDDAGDKEK